MKRNTLITLIGITMIGIYGLFSPGTASSGGVDVHIGIGLPVLPTVVIPAPPAVVMIPNTPVYYAPDVGIELFSYSDHWHRRHRNHWYRASYRLQEKDFGLRYRSEFLVRRTGSTPPRIPPSGLAKIIFLKPIL